PAVERPFVVGAVVGIGREQDRARYRGSAGLGGSEEFRPGGFDAELGDDIEVGLDAMTDGTGGGIQRDGMGEPFFEGGGVRPDAAEDFRAGEGFGGEAGFP